MNDDYELYIPLNIIQVKRDVDVDVTAGHRCGD